MRYNKIRKMDISNGPGVRTSIFVQGCTFKCKNCFNPETHDFKGGKEFTEETIEKILDLSSRDYIVGLSILGGDPMEDQGIVELFFDRSEQAIVQTDQKYGFYCYSIAKRILSDPLDAEESVNDTYYSAWKLIPPRRPQRFSTFLGKITRNLAIDRWRKNTAEKRDPRGRHRFPRGSDRHPDCPYQRADRASARPQARQPLPPWSADDGR